MAILYNLVLSESAPCAMYCLRSGDPGGLKVHLYERAKSARGQEAWRSGGEFASRHEADMLVQEWERCLSEHQNREMVEYITQGLRSGFRIGFREIKILLQRFSRLHTAVLLECPKTIINLL